MPRKSPVVKFLPRQPILLDSQVRACIRKIPDIAFIHQADARMLVQQGIQQRCAGSKKSHHKDRARIGRFHYSECPMISATTKHRLTCFHTQAVLKTSKFRGPIAGSGWRDAGWSAEKLDPTQDGAKSAIHFPSATAAIADVT